MVDSKLNQKYGKTKHLKEKEKSDEYVEEIVLEESNNCDRISPGFPCPESVRYKIYYDKGIEKLVQNSTIRKPQFKIIPLLTRWLSRVFLPEGYPKSVREEYLEYQLWDTVQALSSYLRGILTTKAILEASGVGSENASALAATIVWVIRDGFGILASLCFSYFAASNIDGNAKEWRIFADIINDVGYCINMFATLPMFRDFYLPMSCLASACYSLCGISAGCSKSTITAHFSLQGNLADLHAKENAQETAVTLCGMVVGIFVAKRVEARVLLAWGVFILCTLVHVFASWKCVACLQFRTVNFQRATLLIEKFLEKKFQEMTPEVISSEERLWRPITLALYGPQIGARVGGTILLAENFRWLAGVYKNRQHMMFLEKNRTRVVLHQDSSPMDELFALLQCAIFMKIVHNNIDGILLKPIQMKEAIRESLSQADLCFENFVQKAQVVGWDIEKINIASGAWRYKWKYEK